MIVPRYVPGDWVAVVRDGTVALLPAHVDGRTVDRLWDSLRDGEGFGAQLDVLMERGLASVPPFALVSLADGAVHAIVRGDTQVVVDAEDGEHELDGSAVTTWHEATVRRARSVQVRATTARVDDDVTLPVLSAVVRAAAVEVELVHDAGRPRRAGRPVRAASADRPDRTARATGRAPEPEPVPGPLPDPLPDPVPDPLPDPAPALAEPPLPAPVPSPETPWAPPPTLPAVPATPAGSPVADAGAPEPGDEASPSPDETPVDDVRLPVGGLRPAPQASHDDDHDGLTIQSTDVATLRRQLPEWADDAVPGPFAVPAPSAPPPAKIHLSSGLVISLNRPVLLGRAPQVSRVQNSQIPRLVTVASPNQDISRTHAEVRQEGEHVLVTDLRSTNGVLLLREGSGPQRLHPGEPTVVEPGVVVDLGEGVTFVVEHGT